MPNHQVTNHQVTFTVNDKPVTVPDHLLDLPLVDYLQEDLGLTGTKFCCGIGVCRACTVAVRRQDGAPMDVLLSCSTPLSQLNNLAIYTVEGVASKSLGERGDSKSTEENLHPLQKAFLTHYSFQCGYCTPGFLMAALSLWDRLEKDPIPEAALDQAIKDAIGPHICRCTGYVRYYEAIRSAIIEKGGLVK